MNVLNSSGFNDLQKMAFVLYHNKGGILKSLLAIVEGINFRIAEDSFEYRPINNCLAQGCTV